MGSLDLVFFVLRRKTEIMRAQSLLLLSDCTLRMKRNIKNVLSLPVGSRALYDDIVRRINSPQEQAQVPTYSNLGLALFNTDSINPVVKAPVKIQTPVAVPAPLIVPESRVYAVPETGIHAALAAQEEALHLNSLRVDQQLRALEHEAFVAHEYEHRVEIPEHVEERGRFYNHENIANSFRPVQRKPTIVIGASNSRI